MLWLALSALRPGIVFVSLSAYGDAGPWASRRGFDSLVQTATGFNHAEAQAAGIEGPKELPCQALDHASGYLLAFGAIKCHGQSHQRKSSGKIASRYRMLLHEKRGDPEDVQAMLQAIVNETHAAMLNFHQRAKSRFMAPQTFNASPLAQDKLPTTVIDL